MICWKVKNRTYMYTKFMIASQYIYSPQTNSICERFHKTMQEECYHLLFRKKFYNTLDELQADVDTWLISYNNERSHSGKHCFGKIPMQTFRDSIYLNISSLSDQVVGVLKKS